MLTVFSRRSSHLEMFCKKGAFRNFTKFTGKHFCQSLFFNCRPETCKLIKTETLQRCFPENFCKILLVTCRRFTMVRISDDGPSWKEGFVFRRSAIPQKQFIIIIIEHLRKKRFSHEN